MRACSSLPRFSGWSPVASPLPGPSPVPGRSLAAFWSGAGDSAGGEGAPTSTAVSLTAITVSVTAGGSGGEARGASPLGRATPRRARGGGGRPPPGAASASWAAIRAGGVTTAISTGDPAGGNVDVDSVVAVAGVCPARASNAIACSAHDSSNGFRSGFANRPDRITRVLQASANFRRHQSDDVARLLCLAGGRSARLPGQAARQGQIAGQQGPQLRATLGRGRAQRRRRVERHQMDRVS